MVQYFIHHGIMDHGKPIKEQRAKSKEQRDIILLYRSTSRF